MYKQGFVFNNETHKILRDFEIQIDHLIPARRPDLVIINENKRTCCIADFAIPADHRMKMKENKKTLPEWIYTANSKGRASKKKKYAVRMVG